MYDVPFIDTAGLQALKNFINQFEKKHHRIIISEACPQVIQKLRRAKITDSTKHEIADISFSEAVNIAKTKPNNTF